MSELSFAERTAIVIAAALSPLFFFQPLGVHFGIAEALLAIAFLSYIVRTRTVPLLPAGMARTGAVVFLAAGAVSLLITPLPLTGSQFLLQYAFIFLVVVPIGILAFRDGPTRWYGILALSVTLNLLALLAFLTALTTSVQHQNITLWYGNQNQLYWFVASATLINLCLFAEAATPRGRAAALSLAVIGTYMTVTGLTLTAIIMLAGGVWILVGLFVVRGNVEPVSPRHYSAATALTAAAGVVFVYAAWEWVYWMGSLDTRGEQYSAALNEALVHLPFGAGLGSSYLLLEGVAGGRPSVHNAVLAYLLEIGVFGAAGFVLVLVAWARDAFANMVRNVDALTPLEFAPACIFGTYVVVMMFQPVPLRRYWWILFALAYAPFVAVRRPSAYPIASLRVDR